MPRSGGFSIIWRRSGTPRRTRFVAMKMTSFQFERYLVETSGEGGRSHVGRRPAAPRFLRLVERPGLRPEHDRPSAGQSSLVLPLPEAAGGGCWRPRGGSPKPQAAPAATQAASGGGIDPPARRDPDGRLARGPRPGDVRDALRRRAPGSANWSASTSTTSTRSRAWSASGARGVASGSARSVRWRWNGSVAGERCVARPGRTRRRSS